jgi:CBS-domain-containing membrane protein
MMKEAERLQVDLDELEKLLAENRITTDEYRRRQVELQGKAMSMSQKLMGLDFAQQMPATQSQVCPKNSSIEHEVLRRMWN